MPLTHTLKYFDASDALAVAVCHHFSANGINQLATTKKKSSAKKEAGWNDFIKKNPDRIKSKS